MRYSERAFNLAMGISVLGWATLGTWANVGKKPFAVLLVTSLLHFCVAILFLMRRPVEREGSWQACSLAIPAVLVGGWVFNYSPSHWNGASQILFAMGGSLAIVSFVFLGRCFAILPAIRGTVTRGPYSVVRHPAYLGELTMVLACLIALPMRWKQFIVMPVAILLCVARIVVEERLLLTETAYQEYANRVRWRLLPWLW